MKDNDSIKDKLRQETSLPEGFSWDEMSTGILSKLSDIKSEEPSKSKHRYKIIYLLLFLILGIGGCYKIFNNQNNIQHPLTPEEVDYNRIKNQHAQEVKRKETNQSDRDNISQDDIIANKSMDTVLNQEPVTANNLQIFALSEDSSPLAYASSRPGSVNNIEATFMNPSNKFAISANDAIGSTADQPSEKSASIVINNKSSNNISDKIKEINSDYFVTIPTVINESESVISDNDKSIPDLQNDPLPIIRKSGDTHNIKWELQILPQGIIASLDANNELSFPKLEIISIIPVEKTFNAEWGISLGLGSNYMTERYSNTNFGLERNNNDISIPGISGIVSAEYRFTKSLGLFTGLHWNRYFSEFNYIHQSSTQHLRENQLVQIRTSVLTGQVSHIRADVLGNVSNTRTVRHFNKTDQWSVPLGVRFYLGGSRLEYHIGVGALFSLQKGQVGKTLLNGEIIEYGPENKIFSQRLSYGMIGGIGLRYNLGKGYFFGSNIYMTKSLSNWSTELDLQLNPTIISGSFSLGIKF